MSKTAATWINAIAFQLVWIASVGSAARGLWWPGPLSAAVFAMYQLLRDDRVRIDAILMLIAMPLGFIADSAVVQAGLATYAAAVPSAHVAPIWIVALWANFALTLNHSLAWLQGRPWLAAALGAFGAPLSYFFAARTWHALTLTEPLVITLGTLAAIWAVVTPLLCQTAMRLNRPSVTLQAAMRVPGVGP
jgi:Protein of unknown function (DUF2878)